MQTKHTPGPWKAENLLVMEDVTTTKYHICLTNGNRFTKEEAAANAKLIAAAPELLQALVKLQDAYESLCYKHYLRAGNNEVFVQTKNIVEKATL